jgi:uncharacterized membrane protein
VGVESIAIWQLLYLIGAVFHQQDFKAGHWLNWHSLSVAVVLVLVGVLYTRMEIQRRQSHVG